jgi:hypothetical protein
LLIVEFCLFGFTIASLACKCLIIVNSIIHLSIRVMVQRMGQPHIRGEQYQSFCDQVAAMASPELQAQYYAEKAEIAAKKQRGEKVGARAGASKTTGKNAGGSLRCLFTTITTIDDKSICDLISEVGDKWERGELSKSRSKKVTHVIGKQLVVKNTQTGRGLGQNFSVQSMYKLIQGVPKTDASELLNDILDDVIGWKEAEQVG